MAAKKKTASRPVKRTAKRRAAARRPSKARPRAQVREGAKALSKPARAAKKPGKGARGTAPRERAAAAPVPVAVPVPVTPSSLELVQVAPLRGEAAAALGRQETVQFLVGASEDGARVETLVFPSTRTGAQSSGTYVHRGEWNGTRLVTEKGHLLDVDGLCFCRDCEAAGGYTIDDDE
jgi:hypothetical protein